MMTDQNLSDEKNHDSTPLLIRRILRIMLDEAKDWSTRQVTAELLESIMTQARVIKAQVLKIGMEEFDLYVSLRPLQYH